MASSGLPSTFSTIQQNLNTSHFLFILFNIFVAGFRTIQNIVDQTFVFCLLQIPRKEGPYLVGSSVLNIVKDWAYVMPTINICRMDGWPAFKISSCPEFIHITLVRCFAGPHNYIVISLEERNLSYKLTSR